MSKLIPINEALSHHLTDASTSLQEAQKIAIEEFSLYIVKTPEDAVVLSRLAQDARLLLDLYLQAHISAKMYTAERVAVSGLRG